MILRLFLLSVLIFMTGPAQAQELTVEQAYASIYEDRIPFDRKQSTLPEADAKYLEHLFFVTDMAMRMRVMLLTNFKKGDIRGLKAYESDINELLASFEMVQTPESLKKVQAEVIEAIGDQKLFFKAWAATAGTQKYAIVMKSISNDPLVFSSHQKLMRAYKGLTDAYPGESGYNQKAFYSHLCALDFI